MQIVNPLNITGWDELLEDHDGATIFHSSAWAKVLSETYRYDPKYFVRFSGDRLSTLLPLMEVRSIFTGTRAVSLPFTDFSPPIVEDEDDLNRIFDASVVFGREAGWKRIELRGVKPGRLKGQPAVEYLTHDLDLESDIERMRSKVHESAMRNVRKSLRKGVTIEQRNTLEGIRHFYTLNRLTRKRHGLPPQPYSFLASVHRNIISRGLGTVWLALYQGKCVAGAIFFNFKDRVLFKYGASDARYHRLRANNLVMWEAISKYAEGEYRTLNFGRTDLENSGLRRFKTGWGSIESSVSYYTYDLSTGSFVREGKMVKEWQKRILTRTPVPILGLLGSLMYRHIG